MEQYQIDLINTWKSAKAELEVAKEREAYLRKKVASEFFDFDENSLIEGTKNFDLGEGYKLKAVFKVNRTLQNANGELDKVLEKMEASGEQGKFIADRLVKWTPSLSVSEYRDLPEKFTKMIDSVMTTRAGTPTVEFVEPKKK